MADIFSKEKRSEIMARIKSKETGIERIVFSHLRKRGVYFKKHHDTGYANIDIALPKSKIAIFIDGDYWHGWKFETKSKKMSEFWKEKISGNIRRDRRKRKRLMKDGWKVMKVWEHDIYKKREQKLDEIELFLSKPYHKVRKKILKKN